MSISLDSQAILLLCSQIGLILNPEYKALTLRDWNPLAKNLQVAGMRPGDLLGMSTGDMVEGLGVSSEEALRYAYLLQRSGVLAIELERLESLGIFALTRADKDYPKRYRQRLKEAAPAVLFYAGDYALLGQPGIAVVGSRHLDEVGQACAEFVGNACGLSGKVLYSGGARGVDTISMDAALQSRGTAVGVLANSLETAIRHPAYREALGRGDLCFVTPYSPNAPFSVGMAMGRNRLIYTLADYAVVVASDAEKGGTWAGATEALKAKWLPVFVLEHPAMPEGNKALIKRGGIPLPHPLPVGHEALSSWLEENATNLDPDPEQLSFF